MILLLTDLLRMPPPPIPGGVDLGAAWWRILGLVVVTLITIVILALIFRPTVKSLTEELAFGPDDDHDRPGPSGPNPSHRLTSTLSTPSGGLIRLPNRLSEPDLFPDTFTVAAASERLRRLTSTRSTQPGHFPERRRLGTRRTDVLSTEPRQTLGPKRREPDVPVWPNLRKPSRKPEGESDTAQPNAMADKRLSAGPNPPDVHARVVVESANRRSKETRSDERLITTEDSETNETRTRDQLQMESEGASEERGAEVSEPVSDEDWGLLGDLANRMPSRDDQSLLDKGPVGFMLSDKDLLGDVVNRLPSDADRVAAERRMKLVFPAIIKGENQSDEDAKKIAVIKPQSGKLVQFVPRPIAPLDDAYKILESAERASGESTQDVAANVTRIPVDAATREAVTATVQELLFCANVGEFMHGFALYSDKFLFKFMDDSGLNEVEFRKRFSEIPPKAPSDWTRIDSIESIRRLDDGRVSARVRFIDGSSPNGSEDFTFKLDKHTQRWLIDNIKAV